MRVCLLNDSYPPVIDGVANVVLNYSRILHEEGLAEVIVGTPKYPNTDYSVYPYKVVPYSSIDTTKIVKGYRAGNPFDLKEIYDLSEFKPDIIHTHCPMASTYVARMIKPFTDAPIIFTYHTKFDEDIARAVKGEFIQKETIKFLIKNVDACDEVWVVSNGAGENLRSLGYQGDYRVMNNGVDFAKGRVSEEEVINATKDYDLPQGVPVYLFVGRIIEYKGIPIILDAMAKLKAAGNDFRMVFIGSGPDLDIFKNKAKEFGLMGGADSDKCIFTGPIYDRNVLRAWNTRADLFIFPSTYDTNGIVVREAAACGLASVLIKDSCASEGVTDNRNGFLIEQNAQALYELLIKLSNNIEYMHEIGQNAMDEIYISWEDSVHTAYERYQEIIELKKSGAFGRKIPSLSDYFADMSEEIERETKEFMNIPSRLFDNMMDNVEEFKSDLLEFNHDVSEFKNNMEKDLTKKISQIKEILFND